MEDAVELILAGATAVQVGTAMYGGYGVFDEINRGIEQYMKRKKFRKPQELVGLGHR